MQKNSFFSSAKILLSLCIISVICSGCADRPAVNQTALENSAVQSEAAAQSPDTEQGFEELPIHLEDAEAVAAYYFEKAFDQHLGDAQPDLEDTTEDFIALTYRLKPDTLDTLSIHLTEGYQFPNMLYHFQHPNDEDIDITKDDSFVFPNELVRAARDFVKNVYGVDCTSAKVLCYGYQNKLAVSLEVEKDQIFDVRFFYKEVTPAGCMFYISQQDAEFTKNYYAAKVFDPVV